MMDPADGVPTLAVFSHPNHELAVFGLLQRVRPHIVYLTDGGGKDRVAQTRAGLAAIGLLDRARFLNHSERSFYDALLRRDCGFFETVAEQVRTALPAAPTFRVMCDAIEFYNPVHDVALPVVRSALRNATGFQVYEIPLVRQTPGAAETYAVQRLPESRQRHQVTYRLSPAEAAAKANARENVYTILRDQMGATLSGLKNSHGAEEVFVPAASRLPRPNAEVVLRYEHRGRLLLDRGEIAEIITYRDHYVPAVRSLWSNQRAAAGAPS